MQLSLQILLETLLLFSLLLFGRAELVVGQGVYDIRVNSSLPTTAFPNLTHSSVVVAHQQSPKPYALILCFVPLLTVFGNALVILAVYKERSLQTATNFLIVSLAVSDFLVATCVMSFAIYFEWNSFVWDLGATLCNLFIGVDVACSTASILNLFSITLDRYMAISHPLAYTQYGTNNARAVLSICLVWGISITVGLPVFFGANNKAIDDSRELICEFNNAYFIIFSSLLSFFAPCAIMILLYTVIFRRLKQREKARSLRNLRKSRKSCHANNLATARLENEKISSALLTGAKMARQVGNHFKTRADQMLIELSLQTSSFPTASPSLTESNQDLYGSRMNGGVFNSINALPPPTTLLGSSFSRLSFSSLQQQQQGFLKRSNTVPLSRSPFLNEKSPKVSSNNLSTTQMQKSELEDDPNCDVKECKEEDFETNPRVIENISQMVEKAIEEGLNLASSPEPNKKWVSFGENIYGSSHSSTVLVIDQTRLRKLWDISIKHHKVRGLKSLNFAAAPSLISLPVTHLNAEDVKNSEDEVTSPNPHPPIIPNGKIIHSSSPPPCDSKPSPPSTLLKHISASTKNRKTPIRMSMSNGNLEAVVNYQLSLPIHPSPLVSRAINHREPNSPSFCNSTSLGEAHESTNNPTIHTPTANNHKLSSTETLQNFNWKGLGCFCCCQKIDHWIAGWNQSSKRSNESSTTPGPTTTVGDRSPRLQPSRSTRSQPCPAMSRDTNNNNKEKGEQTVGKKHLNSVMKYGGG
uniref:G-protein coupled receptors family 1 profile domain-containing protein n=1 Tax=Ditylenchus dipsaci TaxID=166011 RepID=A0A915DCF5_9BILA